MNLTKKEKEVLLELAKSSITSLFESTQLPEANYNLYPSLELQAGAFVTLSIEGNLRGCIGYIITDEPLYDTVINAAKQAAIGDPRFPALTEGELEMIDIEISVLSPPFKMNSYDEIELGKHGLILTDGLRRGLLLPQVPIEHSMDRDQFLSALCQKAGLPSKKWKTELLIIEMFTAAVFSENKLDEENG